MTDPRFVRALLAFATLAMLFGALLLIALGNVQHADRDILLVLLGAIITNSKDALGFFFGTSQSSQEKTAYLAGTKTPGGEA